MEKANLWFNYDVSFNDLVSGKSWLLRNVHHVCRIKFIWVGFLEPTDKLLHIYFWVITVLLCLIKSASKKTLSHWVKNHHKYCSALASERFSYCLCSCVSRLCLVGFVIFGSEVTGKEQNVRLLLDSSDMVSGTRGQQGSAGVGRGRQGSTSPMSLNSYHWTLPTFTLSASL